MSSQFFQDKEFNAGLVPVGTGMYKYTDVQSTHLTLEKIIIGGIQRQN